MKVGDIVTIIIDMPYGVDDEYVKDKVGLIVEKEGKLFRVRTNANPLYDGYWYTVDEFRLATETEIASTLKEFFRSAESEVMA